MSKIESKFFNYTYGDSVETIADIDVKTEKGRKNFGLLVKNVFEDNYKKSEETKEIINNINIEVGEKTDKLQYKINKVVEKVRGAILAERGTSGAIYTTQVPINKQQISENTTTTIRDNIAFGIPQSVDNIATDITLLQLKTLEFKNLYLSSINKSSLDLLQDFVIQPKTQTSTPIEFKINLTGIVRTDSSLVLELKTHNIVEVYKNDIMIRDKELIKNIIIPIDISTLSISFRFYPSIHRMNTIEFNKIGYTELIYDRETIFESKNININRDLSQLVIDTCDNSDDSNIDMNYFISINDEEWESFAPVQKHKALEKQSIITLDKSKILTMYESIGVKNSEGDYRFYIPNNLQTNLVYEHPIYLKNNKRITNKEFILIPQNDIKLVKAAILNSSSHKLFLNDKEVLDEEFNILKGINKLVAIYNNTIQPIKLSYIETLIGKDNIFIGKLLKEILKDENNEKYISLSVPEFKDSFDTKGSVYFPGLKLKKTINTIKIRAVLSSKNKKTVPYISRILVRGI